MHLFFKILSVALCGIGLVSCASTPKPTSRCPQSHTPIEGRIDDYFPCMQVYRTSPYSAFKMSTVTSGIEKTDDIEKRVIWPHAEAYVGQSEADWQTRIYFSLSPYDRNMKFTEQPPSSTLKAYISGWAEALPVSYLRRSSDVDMGVVYETDHYFIALSPAFINKLRSANPSSSLSYRGEAFTVNIDRPDYEDLSFEMNPSEILAVTYAAKTEFACPIEKAPKVNSTYSLKYYVESCPFTVEVFAAYID